MSTKKLYLLLCILFSVTVFSQKKIDTDSLLVKTNELFKKGGNTSKVIQLCRLGIKSAPNYLDFYVTMGRAMQQNQQIDSARYYYNYVLARNTKYKDTYLYLTHLEINNNSYDSALVKINDAISLYPDDKELLLQKLRILCLFNDATETKNYLVDLLKKYPDDLPLKQQLIQIRALEKTDLVGVNYSYTGFDRSSVGPWHLVGLQYTHQGKKISFTGMVNYVNRFSLGTSIAEGVQYEAESYLKHTAKSYAMGNIAFSNGKVFPEFRVAYSFYHTFNKGWEPEIGFRYTQTTTNNIYTGVLGGTKYIGSYWLNLRSFWQYDQSKIYPAVTITARYYFDTKYDYVSTSIGYGSSPDERETLGVFDQRFTLTSYRFGAGYHHLFGTHYIAGLQGSMNHQQYNLDNFQNEYSISLLLHYKF